MKRQSINCFCLYWCRCRDGRDDLTDKIDFIVCLGGDGTLLYASLLFQQSVPPVMAFHLGSLGFLTPFQFDNFQEQVTNVLEGHAALTLRSRLRCIIVRKNQEQTEICDKNWITQGAIGNEENSSSNGKQQKTAANILVCGQRRRCRFSFCFVSYYGEINVRVHRRYWTRSSSIAVRHHIYAILICFWTENTLHRSKVTVWLCQRRPVVLRTRWLLAHQWYIHRCRRSWSHPFVRIR